MRTTANSVSTIETQLLVVIAVLWVSGGSSLLAQNTSPTSGGNQSTDWDVASMDVTVNVGFADASHDYVPNPREAKIYHWERRQSGGQSKTVMTVQSPVSPPITGADGTVTTLQNPNAIVRVEDDEDGLGPRLYNGRGELVPFSPHVPTFSAKSLPLPDPDQRHTHRPHVQTGGNWLDGILIQKGKSGERRGDLERRYGVSTEKVRGLSRYVRHNGNDIDELLVDPDAEVPVEINRVKKGALVFHETISYELQGNGDLLQRRTHSERLAQPGSDRRRVVDVEFSNLHVGHEE